MKWIRYRFYTEADDNRPIVFNPSYPWWVSGYSGNGECSICIAYLPKGESLEKFWPEAHNIEADECESIEFSSRFPKPDYYTPLQEAKEEIK